VTPRDADMITDRRAFLRGSAVLTGAVLASAMPALPRTAAAQSAKSSFEQWRDTFRPQALARGVSEATYARVMAIKPDTSVYSQIRTQPEFNEALWQYLNRRVSDWRVITGKKRAREHSALLSRIENDYGVDRFIMLALWGIESSYGEVIGRSFRRWPRSPGASRAAAAIGKRSCSTLSCSSSAAGADLRR
jgi:membrane-bound lytic murein transglycosylase B